MRKLLIALAFITPAAVAHAQSTYGWGSYDGYGQVTQGYMNGVIAGGIAAQQRANEAFINEMRAARGLPPCSLAIIRLDGRPAC